MHLQNANNYLKNDLKAAYNLVSGFSFLKLLKNWYIWFRIPAFIAHLPKLFSEMLQRIQTVYMGLAALLTITLVLIFPIYSYQETVVMATDNPVVFFFFGFCSGGLLANIFNFKKRSLQIVLNRIIMFGFLLTLGFAITDRIGSGDAQNVTFGLALLAPPIGVVLIYIANRYIKKDEKLIKSADRIR